MVALKGMTERDFAAYLAQKSFEKKAENVVILDLEGRSPVADHFLIVSGTSDRQVMAIAEHLAQMGRQIGQRPINIEGMQDGRWAVIDFGGIIVHVFLDYLREYYSLESLWKDAPRTRVRDASLPTPAYASASSALI